jgi:hypothetical protein
VKGLVLIAVVGTALVVASGAFAKGGGNNGCAAYSNLGMSVPDLTASWTVSNCGSKPEFINDTFALRDLAGNQIWIASAGDIGWLNPGESRSGSFGGIGFFGGMVSGQTYDLHFAAQNWVTDPTTGLTKIDVVGTGDTTFVAP